ncbi:hypothetical protein TPHV1_240003 [Treponema phagedenis]|uniref:Uncharacterized protein n=1 Tax=Treponema phagedenis TaxID=162 RepID=A0A0B7GTZ2_TREPH|nr:hypothetical protein TPHV1_240003 [Treponema phagedenis]
MAILSAWLTEFTYENFCIFIV